MMNRLGVLVAVSAAAYAIRQLPIRSWSSLILPTNCSENGEDTENNGLAEEEEEANSVNESTSQVTGRTSDHNAEMTLNYVAPRIPSQSTLILPTNCSGGENSSAELRELLTQESENRLLDDNKIENSKIELDRLLKLVMELELRKVKLEGELLMCDEIKHDKTNVAELLKQLEAKNDDINTLNITIKSLQAERKKLQEEILKGASMKTELEKARDKIKELQKQIQLDANKTKEHLLLLKQRVSSLQAKEEEGVKKEAELYKRLKAAKDFEIELETLKRKNRELRHERKELTSKLDVMKAQVTTLRESEIITKETEEAQNLRSENENLIKQLEELQMNRFSEVEELVYLRWINACLRYELRDNETSIGESARFLNKSLSPKSKEKAKQLMLEYAELDFGQAETDHESNFSHPISSGIEDFDKTSIDSSMSRTSSFSEKPNSNLSLKKFIRNKGGSSGVSSQRITGSSYRGKNPLEEVMAVSAAETSTLSEVKADMETHIDMIMPLAKEVREASFSKMDDVVSFVIRLDEKLSSLVDEKEILEHVDWPDVKAYALKEAAFEYQNLMKLGEEVSSFVDSPKLTCEVALKKMHSLLDKVEQSVHEVVSTRDATISRYEELGIPIDWLLDSGVVAKMKVSCVQLARKYMKRIVNEHNALSGQEKQPKREFLLLQGVRFASRVHKWNILAVFARGCRLRPNHFAGGFDLESMKAFEELRSRIYTEAVQRK